MNAIELRALRAKKLTEAEALRLKAENEHRSLTDDEMKTIKRLLDDARSTQTQIEAFEGLELELRKPANRRLAAMMPASTAWPGTSAMPIPSAEWRDAKTGKPVHLLGRERRMTDLPMERTSEFKPGDLSFGRLLRALVTGSWMGAEAEQRAMMATGINVLGGVLVPDLLSAMVIDAARAQSVLVRAGAGTIPMTSGDLTIAKIVSDPEFTVKGENVAFPEANPTLGAIQLTARTIGCLVPASRELAEDAPNFAELIEAQLVAALAAKLDYYGLQGNGALEPLGIHESDSVLAQAAAGALTTYDKIFTAIQDIEEENEVPTAWIMAPAMKAKFDAFIIDTKANYFPTIPPGIAALSRFVSTQVYAGDVIVGDFTKMLMGIRSDSTVEVSSTAGDAFKKHQILIKIVFRGDWGFTRPHAIEKLTGCS